MQRPSQPQNVTVVVENPMSVDEKGKLVISYAQLFIDFTNLLNCGY